MPNVSVQKTILRAGLVLLASSGLAAAQDWATVSQLFEDRCVFCHSGEFAPTGLQLDSYAAVIAGSENGPVVTPGGADDSPLYHRITGQASPRMPLDGPPFLNDDEIALIAAWITEGATGPASEDVPSDAPPPDPRADGQIVYSEVARIFGQACIRCHSDNGIMDGPPKGLRLDSYEAILAGGDRIALIPGNAQASEVVRRIEGLASPRMPIDGPPWLDTKDIALIRDWIDAGALSDDLVMAPVPVDGRVRLRGILTAPNEIDGSPFSVTAQTRGDDQPSVGTQAEVRARITASGGLQAQRLRER